MCLEELTRERGGDENYAVFAMKHNQRRHTLMICNHHAHTQMLNPNFSPPLHDSDALHRVAEEQIALSLHNSDA